MPKSAKTKAREDSISAALKKPSAPAPEVKDGLTDRAEALETNLKLNPSQLKEMENWIFDRMELGFRSTERHEAIQRINQARERYENGVARDDKPFDNASDVRLRWGAAQADTFSVRMGEGVFGQDPVVRINARNSVSIEKAPVAERFLDWWHDEFWHLGDRGPDITDNVTREGHRILHMPYRLEIAPDVLQQVEKRAYVSPITGKTRWVDVDSMNEMVKAIEDGLRATDDYKLFDVKRDKVLMNGPDLEDLAFEDYVTVPYATPANERELPWEAVRQWHFYDTVKAMDEDGDLYPGTLARVEADLVTPPSGKGGSKSGDAKTGEPAKQAKALDSMVETWLWWGLYKLPGQKRLTKVFALCHVPSRTVLWARPFRLESWESPVTHLRFLQMDWRFDGVSAMELFDSVEQAAQNLINYALDETYMLASTNYTYRENRFDPADHPLRPWGGIAVKSHGDIQWNNQVDRRPIDLNLMRMLMGYGEQRLNIGPAQRGQDPAQDGASTARGLYMLLQQSSKMFDRAVRGQLKTWKSVFAKEMALWEQTMPEYMAIDAVGEDGALLFPMGMGRRYIVGKFTFEMSGNVENVLYDLDRQTTMALYDLFKENPLVKASLTSFYNLSNDVWKSFKRKGKLLPPLDELQKKLNLLPTPPPMTAQKQRELVAELKAAGLKDPEIEKFLKKVNEIPVDMPAPQPTMAPPLPFAPGRRPAGPMPDPVFSPEDLPPEMMGAGGEAGPLPPEEDLSALMGVQ